jgi:transposase-like protein/IS1 family transposase
MTCLRCKHQGAKKFGTYGKRRIQRYRCISCRSTFAEPQPTSPLGTMRTSEEAAIHAMQCLIEGCSIRSTERLTGLNRNTILRLLEMIGPRCARLMDSRMRGLHCRYVQCDEIWTFVQKKQRQVRGDANPYEIGDQWVFVAMDAETKLVASFQVGKRTMESTKALISDLHGRLANQIQLTTDGFHFYQKAVEEAFGLDVDFAQLVKLYGDYGQHGTERYSPSPIIEVISKVRIGKPSKRDISTSFVERQNLTMRMAMRRFTRLTNAFSKKLENLKLALAVHFAYYNFCRVHATLRVTPAMEAGLSDHVWSVAELLRAV